MQSLLHSNRKTKQTQEATATSPLLLRIWCFMFPRGNQGVILWEKRPPWQFLEQSNIGSISQLCPYTIPSLAKYTVSSKAMYKFSPFCRMYHQFSNICDGCIKSHALHQGIMVRLWEDIAWSSHSASWQDWPLCILNQGGHHLPCHIRVS